MARMMLCEDVGKPEGRCIAVVWDGSVEGHDPCPRCRLPGGFPKNTGALCDDCDEETANFSDFDWMVDTIEWLNGLGRPWVYDPKNRQIVEVASWNDVPDPELTS